MSLKSVIIQLTFGNTSHNWVTMFFESKFLKFSFSEKATKICADLCCLLKKAEL